MKAGWIRGDFLGGAKKKKKKKEFGLLGRFKRFFVAFYYNE
jgi:hypothetical protein